MKKALFFLIFLVIGGFAAKAQYVPVDGPLSYKWGGIYDANGHRLSRDEGNANYFLTPQQQRMFKRGRNQYLWGAGITNECVYRTCNRNGMEQSSLSDSRAIPALNWTSQNERSY